MLVILIILGIIVFNTSNKESSIFSSASQKETFENDVNKNNASTISEDDLNKSGENQDVEQPNNEQDENDNQNEENTSNNENVEQPQ